MATLTRIAARVAPNRAGQTSRTRLPSIDMPTLMKNRPSSMPRNGSISASSWWRKFDSASRMPARNAPIAIDRPTCSMRSAVPSTTRSAAAVITSRAPLAASSRKKGFRP